MVILCVVINGHFTCKTAELRKARSGSAVPCVLPFIIRTKG